MVLRILSNERVFNKIVFLLIVCFCNPIYPQVNAIDDLSACSRQLMSQPFQQRPKFLQSAQNRGSACSWTIEDISEMNSGELVAFLVGETEVLDCINRVLYGFNTELSPLIFLEDNVSQVALAAETLSNSFDGQTNNGVYGTFTYLSIASHLATFYPNDIQYSVETWDRLKGACIQLSQNKNIFQQSETSLFTIGHMLFTASFGDIGADPKIIAFSKDLLDLIASDSYEGLPDYYPYYYCYYYLLDVYFRYPSTNPLFIEELESQDSVIQSLGNVAVNLNLNGDTYNLFEELSNHSVVGITRHAEYPELHHVVEPALRNVVDTYDEFSSRWVHAGLSLVQNGFSFDHTESEIISYLETTLLPNSYFFEDGKIQISTPLDYEEALALYQSILIVRSQFFRMIQDDQPVPGDLNEILRVKLYGDRTSYQEFNNVLYNVNYPNSGGVYIESHGTFYTYQRTPQESLYSLEELFRHEYVHYLQGRYIVPGLWGQSPIYDNSRMVWFEEGMAQHLSGSTRKTGVKSLDVIRSTILDQASPQDLNLVLNSSYSSGNQDAYYVYAPILWQYWNQHDVLQLKHLTNFIKENDLNSFDQVVSNYRNSTQQNNVYLSFVSEIIVDNDMWITPTTIPILPETIDYSRLPDIQSEFENVISELDLDQISISVNEEPKQFLIEATLIQQTSGESGAGTNEINEALNQMLGLLEASTLNNFDYTTAYFNDSFVGENVNVFIEGPLNDLCRSPIVANMQSEAYEDFAYLFNQGQELLSSQFRYRSLGTLPWINLSSTTSTQDTIENLNSLKGYEYQLRQECSENEWSSYSNSKYFTLCPLTQQLKGVLPEDDLKYSAVEDIKSAQKILNQYSVDYYTGRHAIIAPLFEIEKGGVLQISNFNCRERQ